MTISPEAAEQLTRDLLAWLQAENAEDENAVPALLIAAVKIAARQPVSTESLCQQLGGLLRIVAQEEVLRRTMHEALAKDRTPH